MFLRVYFQFLMQLRSNERCDASEERIDRQADCRIESTGGRVVSTEHKTVFADRRDGSTICR